MLLFICISFFSFSSIPSFNTSHVVIYPSCTSTPFVCLLGFNTSHVVIYLSAFRSASIEGRVSIHLMLLFINTESGVISLFNKVSIHLMLLFIQKEMTTRFDGINVSIHLMLLFIRCVSLEKFITGQSFNTSHVVIYRSNSIC